MIVPLSFSFLQGCLPATTFKGSRFCPAYLSNGDNILVGALPGEHWEYPIDAIREELKSRDVKVSYAPEQEWKLRSAGIVNPLDTTYYPRLIEHGITHILLVREMSSNRSNVYSYRTPFEMSQELNPFYPVTRDRNETNHEAELAVDLLAIKTRQSYSFIVTSRISGVELRHNDGGRSSVNAGSVEQARNLSIKKSAKRIANYCR